MQSPTRVLDYDRTSWVKVLNISLKIALVVTFAVAIIFEPPERRVRVWNTERRLSRLGDPGADHRNMAKVGPVSPHR